MAQYNAPKPTYTNWQSFKSLAVRVVFPPILLWDLSKLAINKLVGKIVSHKVLPAQHIDFTELLISNASNLNTDQTTCEQHKVVTYDGAFLDTFEIKHASQQHHKPEHQTYIIKFTGNSGCYERNINEMQCDATELQSNVVGFNFRGVNGSTGQAKSKDDLVNDGIAQVQRLLDQGVSSCNITLKGHSLGAGIASLVALHFHQLGQPINIFNSRSFSSITNVLVGTIRHGKSGTGHTETLSGKILGLLAKPFIKLGVSLANWEINAGNAFKAIPAEYKDYIVVRTQKKNRDGQVLDDTVICHYASIHVALKKERHLQKKQIDALIRITKDVEAHTDPDAKPNLKHVAVLHEAKAHFKDRKMEAPAHINGHDVNMAELKSCSGKSAATFFQEFAARVRNHHGSTPILN